MTAFSLTFAQSRDAILSAAGLLVALGVIWRYTIRPVVRFFQRLERVMVNVEDQLYPNGGASLRDAVTQVQKKLGIDPKLPDRPFDPKLPERKANP